MEYQCDTSFLCKHEDIIDGCCLSCNQYVEKIYSSDTFSKKHGPVPKQRKSFVEEIKKMSLPDDVKNRAIKIYFSMNISTHRAKKLKKVIFCCTFAAFHELGQKPDPKLVAKICGISEKEMGDALKICRENITGYRFPDTNTSPLDLLPNYYIDLGLNPCNYHLLEAMSKRILESKEAYEILDMTPQNVAAALLQYFIEINGITFEGQDTKEKIAKIVNISNMTITNIVTKITIIDNQ